MFKLIAIITMTLDHIGFYFTPILPEPLYLFLRIAGRLAFPMFVYSIVMGMFNCRKITSYGKRLFFLALFSELPVRIFLHFSPDYEIPPNVIFTLLCGLILISGLDFLHGMLEFTKAEYKESTAAVEWAGLKLTLKQGKALALSAILISFVAIHIFKPDYSYYGLAMFIIIYYCARRKSRLIHLNSETPRLNKSDLYLSIKNQQRNLFICLSLFSLLHILLQGSPDLTASKEINPAIMQTFAIFFVIFIPFYFKDKRPTAKIKFIYYLYFPLHHLLLFILSNLIL